MKTGNNTDWMEERGQIWAGKKMRVGLQRGEKSKVFELRSSKTDWAGVAKEQKA